MKEFKLKEITGRNGNKGLIQHRYGKMSELEFRTTIISILVQVEKSIESISLPVEIKEVKSS